MNTLILLIVIGAHLIADFWLQTHNMIRQKEQNGISLWHLFWHFVCPIALLMAFKQMEFFMIIPLILITVVHAAVDYSKVIIQKQQKVYRNDFLEFLTKKSTLFVGDQIVHLISVYTILRFFNNAPSTAEILTNIERLLFAKDFFVSGEIKLIIMIIAAVVITHVSAFLIEFLLAEIKSKVDGEQLPQSYPAQQSVTDAARQTAASMEGSMNDAHQGLILQDMISTLETSTNQNNKDIKIESTLEKHSAITDEKSILKITYAYQKYDETYHPAGRYIGMLERLLIVVLVVQQAYAAIAFLGAMKTLTRFKQFDEKGFSEIFLLGTFMSVLVGLLAGIFLYRILGKIV